MHNITVRRSRSLDDVAASPVSPRSTARAPCAARRWSRRPTRGCSRRCRSDRAARSPTPSSPPPRSSRCCELRGEQLAEAAERRAPWGRLRSLLARSLSHARVLALRPPKRPSAPRPAGLEAGAAQSPRPAADGEPVAQPLVDGRVVQQRQVVRAAERASRARRGTGFGACGRGPTRSAPARGSRRAAAPSGCAAPRVTVAATKQCVGPSQQRDLLARRGAQRVGIAVAPVLVDQRALAQVADAGAAPPKEARRRDGSPGPGRARAGPVHAPAPAARPCEGSPARRRAARAAPSGRRARLA